MLTSVVLDLRARDEAPLPPFLGKSTHALFLRLIDAVDPPTSARLHGEAEVKPFTVSDVLGLPLRGKARHITAGQECLLRFTSYEASLSSLLTSAVPASLPAVVEIADGSFSIDATYLEDSLHPLCGQTSYGELAERHLLRGRKVSPHVRLFFASPTTFRSAGKNVPLPLPGLVFGSLVDRWNAFSPVTLPAEVRAYAEEYMAISQCHVRTSTVDIAGGRQVGFTGACAYVALDTDPYWLRIVHLLSAFAFFSGVGYKTTMGLGQTHLRRLNASYTGRIDHRAGQDSDAPPPRS